MANFGNLLVDAFPSELHSTTLASRIWPVDRYPEAEKNEKDELLFASSVANLMSESTKYFTDENIWDIDEFEINQSKTIINQPIRYNFDKRRFSGAVTSNDFSKNFETLKEANRNEIKLRLVFVSNFILLMTNLANRHYF